MKPIHRSICAVVLAGAAWTCAYAQTPPEPTGTPGDHFSLQGALELFKKADSPEAFEKALNTKENNVNNLDLNGDGDIDYIRVVDRVEGGVHALVLQVPASATESQDIAVIGLEKTADANAMVQIVGDEDIFGEKMIVEPGDGDEDEDEEEEGSAGKNALSLRRVRVVVNVWPWPCVRFMFAPVYAPWVSPWRWAVYPTWWRPWRPLAWSVWHPFRHRRIVGFGVVRTHRVIAAHRLYTPGRVVSVSVRTRHSAAVGKYRVTRTTTVRKGPHGGKVKTTRTTVHRGRKHR
jgi:hypothetical protein